MRSVKGFQEGFGTNELLPVADSQNLKALTRLIRQTTCQFLSGCDVNTVSISMWLDSECGVGKALGREAAQTSVRFDQPLGKRSVSSPEITLKERRDQAGLACSSSVFPPPKTYEPGKRESLCSDANEHHYTYLFQIPHKMQSRIALEFAFGSCLRDSSDFVRMEYLVTHFYLAGLRFFDIIDSATARAWMSMIEGISPVQLMILREAVCAPRYSLSAMSERLGIGKRGITGQLYRIQKFVEPRLPEPVCDEGNGSPLVDLVRAFGFLQFVGRPAPIMSNPDDFEARCAPSIRGRHEEEWFAGQHN